MSEHATEIDVAGAEAALEARLAPTRETIEVSRDPESKRFVPAEAPTPAEGEAEGQDPGAAVTETPAEVGQEDAPTEDIFAHIPDEALTPELLAVKRGMEATYTRKTQEIAPLRKIQEDYGFESVDSMKEALDAYKTLSDPENWPRLHSELSTYLQAQGLPPNVADQAAAVSLGDAIGDFPDGTDADPDNDDGEQYGADPRLLQEVAALKQGFTQLQQTLVQEREARSQQEQIETLAAQLTADEQVIRAAHRDMEPEALEDYIETVYDLAGDGDLHAAANRIDSMLGRQAAGYLATKQAAHAVPGVQPGAGVIARDEEEAPHTLEEGHARAMEHVRATEAARQAAGGGPGF